MTSRKVSLNEKLALVDEHWAPKIVARYNDNDVMVVKFQGEFPMHDHPETDDFFLVLKGEVLLDIAQTTETLGPGDLCVVPAGTMHRPRAHSEAHVLLIEPAGTPNTGDASTAVPKNTI